MNEINFSCPKCKMAIVCDDSYSGSPIDCPGCSAKLKVPSSGNKATTAPPSGKITGPPARTQTRVAEVSSTKKTGIWIGITLTIGIIVTWLISGVIEVPPESSSLAPFFGLFLIVSGLILMIATSVLVCINAFRESFMWGLGSLIPFIWWRYARKHWEQNKPHALANIGGGVLIFCGAFVAGEMRGGWNESDGFSATFGSDQSTEMSTPDGTATAIMNGLSDGDAGVLWEALPTSYQKDLNAIIHDYANAIDPQVWNRSFALTKRVVDVLGTKKEYVFENPMFAIVPDKDAVEKHYDMVLQLMTVGLSSDLSKLDNLKTIDVGDYLSNTGSKLLKSASLLMGAGEGNSIRNLAQTAVRVVVSDDRTATLQITFPDQPSQQSEWVKTQERWLPKALVDEWSGFIAESRQAIALMKNEAESSSMQMNMVFGMVEGMLIQFESANSQMEFDAAIEGVMGGMMGGVPGGPTVGQQGRSRPFSPKVEGNLFRFQREKAMAGNRTAQYDLGMRYLRGDGVEQDKEQARNWLKMAASKGDNRAKMELDRLDQGSDFGGESGVIAVESLNTVLVAPSGAAAVGDPSQEELVSRLNDARIYAQGVILFCEAHRQRLPSRLDETMPHLREANFDEPSGQIRFEMVRPGVSEHLLPVIPKSKIIVLRSDPWQQKDEQWGRVYGFADGHSELKTVADGKFAVWEKAH